VTPPWGDRQEEPVIVNGKKTRPSGPGETTAAVIGFGLFLAVLAWLVNLVVAVCLAVTERLTGGSWGHHFSGAISWFWVIAFVACTLVAAGFRRQLHLDRTELKGE
jgi:hydrogenase/urease accessory protein HupE